MADTATAQDNQNLQNGNKGLETLLIKSPDTKEKAVEILKEIKNNGGGIRDISNNSPLGKAIGSLGGNLKYISIDAAIIDFQKKKVELKDNFEEKEEKKNEDKKNKAEEKEKEEKKYEEKEEKDEKNDEKKKNVEVEVGKIIDRAKEKFNNDEKVGKVVKEEVEKYVDYEEIKTEKEKIDDLAKKIAETSGKEVDAEIKMESTRIIKEVNKVELENIEEVREIRRDKFIERYEKQVKELNPEMSSQQLGLAKERAEVIADLYYTDKGLENLRDDFLTGLEKPTSGAIENSWSDFEAVTKLLSKEPEKAKGIIEKLGRTGEKLDFKEPSIRQVLSAKNIGEFFKGKKLEGLVNFGNNPFLTLADRINKLSGGLLGKTFAKYANNFVIKIGNETVKTALQNGLRVFVENGFRQGFNFVAKNLFSGYVKKVGIRAGIKIGLEAGAKVAGTLAAKMGAAAATGPYGWIAALIILAIEVVKKIKNIFGNIAKKLGVSLDIKDKLQGEYGKFGGWLLNETYKLGKRVIYPLIIIGAILMLILNLMNMVASLVPPVDNDPGEDFGSDDYSEVVPGNIPVPKCDSTTHDRRILREIAMSIKGKVEYNRASTWFVIGSHPRWGENCNGEACGLDCAKFVSWVWLQCMGKERGKKELGSTLGLMATANKGTTGWQYIHPKSVDELKIGDIFVRDNTCDGGRRCNHAVLYIGNGETMESTRDDNNPHIDKVYKFTDNGIFLERDKNRMTDKKIYDHIIRIDNVFVNDSGSGGGAPNQFKVGTFNIGNLNKNSRPSAEDIGNKVREVGLDVVGMQEIDQNSSNSKTQTISQVSGLGYYFHTNTPAGNSILSKTTLNNTSDTTLSSCGETRKLQKTILKVNGRDVSFYNAHISPDSSCSKKQLEDIANIVKGDSLPWVLVGDFNLGASYCFNAEEFFGGDNIIHDENYGTKCTDMIIFPKNKGLKLVSSKTYSTNTTLSDHNLVSATLELN